MKKQLNNVSIGKGLKSFQVVFTKEQKAEGKKKPIELAVSIHNIKADNINSAYEWIEKNVGIPSTEILHIYPLASLADGQSIEVLSAYCVRSFERWELRNTFAEKNHKKRNFADREDLQQEAAKAIIEVLSIDSNANMFDCFQNARKTLQTYIDIFNKNSEAEYLPGWSGCNPYSVKPKKASPTAKIIIEAMAKAELTEGQKEALLLYASGLTYREVSIKIDKSLNATIKRIHKAAANILEVAVKDKGLTSRLWREISVEFINAEGEKEKLKKLEDYTLEDVENLIMKYRKK